MPRWRNSTDSFPHSSPWGSELRLTALGGPPPTPNGLVEGGFAWNDLLIALTFVGGSSGVAPITAYLGYLKGGFGENQHLLTAAAFVAMVVPLIVFFSLQRYYARGFTPSGLIRDRSA
jgi:alpha-glucoside transport system permease protein